MNGWLRAPAFVLDGWILIFCQADTETRKITRGAAAADKWIMATCCSRPPFLGNLVSLSFYRWWQGVLQISGSRCWEKPFKEGPNFTRKNVVGAIEYRIQTIQLLQSIDKGDKYSNRVMSWWGAKAGTRWGKGAGTEMVLGGGHIRLLHVLRHVSCGSYRYSYPWCFFRTVPERGHLLSFQPFKNLISASLDYFVKWTSRMFIELLKKTTALVVASKHDNETKNSLALTKRENKIKVQSFSHAIYQMKVSFWYFWHVILYPLLRIYLKLTVAVHFGIHQWSLHEILEEKWSYYKYWFA